MFQETIITPQSQQYSLLRGLGNEPVDDGAILIRKNMENEIWKDIPGYEGLYEISNYGVVKSLDRYANHDKAGVNKKRIKGRVLRFIFDKNGYKKTTLCKDSIPFCSATHRLVALAFIPNPLSLPQVNHKDEIKTNNHASNLEWCTTLYNTQYGTGKKRRIESRIKNKKNILFGESIGTSKLTESGVISIYQSNMPYNALAKLFGISKSNVHHIKTP